jgi:hypothetical protein
MKNKILNFFAVVFVLTVDQSRLDKFLPKEIYPMWLGLKVQCLMIAGQALWPRWLAAYFGRRGWKLALNNPAHSMDEYVRNVRREHFKAEASESARAEDAKGPFMKCLKCHTYFYKYEGHDCPCDARAKDGE